MIFFFLILPPLLAALIATLVRPYRAFVGWMGAWLSLISLGVSFALAAQVINGQIPTWGFKLEFLNLEEVLRVDSLSALLILCVTVVGTLTLFLSPGLGRAVTNPHWGELAYRPNQLRRYHVFINLFISAMLVAVSANNVGVMWIMIEATTVFSAFIIPLKLNKASIEASWKYILICSVGIALAFTGTVLGYFDFVTLSGRAENALNWTVLLGTAPALHPAVMRLAFVFLLVGYGTKAGIAPMHTWKPDAYGEAPGMVGAMLAGGVTSCAFLALARLTQITSAAGEGAYANRLLVMIGLASMGVAGALLLGQRDLKRMLAYSSVEQMGILALATGLGAAATGATLLHLVNNALGKGALFLAVGNLHRAFGGKTTDEVRGALRRLPLSGTIFLLSFFAVTGSPPFGLFVSEMLILKSIFAAGRWLVGGLFLVFLFVVFAGMGATSLTALQGRPPASARASTYRDGFATVSPALLLLAIVLLFGLHLPDSVRTLIGDAARALEVGR